jgi:CubicO group peptidase (beta-lactamase class C family)
MKHFASWAITAAVVVTCSAVRAQGLPTASPEDVGMSSERLTRIDDFVDRHVEAHHFAGAVTVVARRGKVVQFKAYGMQDVENGVPMAKDSIFRIYSMTKPITSVAVMMLFEEGDFLLNDPISTYLPEFKDIGVGVEEIDEATGEKVLTTVPANREVTIRDLLRHTSGLTYGFWGTSMVDKLYLENNVFGRDDTIEETVAKLGAIPLKHQPGTVWEYSVSTDVLGRLVEVLSGQRFDDFLQDRIFGPLGMNDTGFFVPPEKVGRLTAVYTPNEDNTAISPEDPSRARDFTKQTRRLSGGGGLVSTAADYLRFAQMLLNGGSLDGARILGPETIELMTSDHLAGIEDRGFLDPYGFGLGFMISPDRGISGSIVSAGSFGWGGMAHTTFWVDPQAELIGIFLVQILPTSPLPYRELYKPVVYQAIVD